MNKKSQNRLSPADKKQHALHCARERDRWSSGVLQAREEQHLAEISKLQKQVSELASERDAARSHLQQAQELRRQLTEITAQRDSARAQLQQAERLRQQLADVTSERDAAREQLQQAEAQRRQLNDLTSRHDSARKQLQQAGVLRQQLQDITAERDAAQQRVKQLETSLAGAIAAAADAQSATTEPDKPAIITPGNVQQSPVSPAHAPVRHSYRAATAAGAVLTLGILANVLIYHDAQSTVQPQASLQDDAATSLQVLEAQLADERAAVKTAGDTQTRPPQTRKPKTRFAKTGSIELHQWGPPLLLDEGKPLPTKAFDPVVKSQQEGLLALGFDIGKADGFSGPLTRQALKEFGSLYLSALEKQPTGTALAAIIRNYADLARSDAGSFGIDQGVLAAIRLSSVRTGIEFSYLMKLAAVESNFDPVSKSSASSATGLYQFTRDTWLNTVRSHGDKYGLGEYAAKIEYTVDRNGYQRPLVRDKEVYAHLMNLRNNPRVSAMMAAESVKDNLQRLTRSFDRKPSEADLYLTHFFGTDGAISFLRALDKTPDAPAVDMFPAAAQSNQDIFHPKTCKPRTVDEVYELFGEKFNNWRFDVAIN